MIVQVRQALLYVVILLYPGFSASDAAAEDYITRLQSAVVQSRAQLPALTESAERAATEFLSGGNLWAAGRQAEFIAEACQRAGGLMAVAPLAGRVPASHDVILYAVPGLLDDNDRKLLADWQGKGATVVAFSSPAGLFRDKFPLDTVLNVAELWTWTAEFVAACTRLGKMPVLYQSYGLPGGYERAAKYKGKKIHDDLIIRPVAAGVLGGEYLGQTLNTLARIQLTETPNIDRAAGWWRNAKSFTVMVTGHMFPAHAQDPRAFCVGNLVSVPAREDKELLGANPPEFVFYLGYQFAPQKLIEEAKRTGVKLVYTDVQPGRLAKPSANILYISPAWPLSDGCVSVPGYDIPILPASGVVQAAIYWSIVSKAFPDSELPR